MKSSVLGILALFAFFNSVDAEEINLGFVDLGNPIYNIDSTGSRDTTADIQNVLNNLGQGEEWGQATVYVPEGTYKVKDLLIPANVLFQGEGDDTIFLASGNCDRGVIHIRNPRPTIKNITIDGNSDNFDCSGIRLWGQHNVAAGQTPLDGDGPWGVVLDSIHFVNISLHALDIDNSNHIEIKNSFFRSGLQGMISCDRCDNLSIHHNIFQEAIVPYVIDLNVLVPSEESAHSASIYDNWFEFAVLGVINTIKVNAHNVSVFNNYFAAHHQDANFKSHILVETNASNTNIYHNNFRVGKSVIINEGASRTTIRDNSGINHASHNITSVLDNGDHTLIEYFDSTHSNRRTVRLSDSINFGTTDSLGPPGLAIDPNTSQFRIRSDEYFGSIPGTHGVVGVKGLFGIELRAGQWTNPNNGHVRKGNVRIGNENGESSYDYGHLVLGTYHIWVDTTGNLRIKNGKPTHDTDGKLVGDITE